MVRAFLRWSYGLRAVTVGFVGRETSADFVDQGEETDESMADGWRGPYREEE